MKKLTLFLTFIVLLGSTVLSQTISFNPYLQDVSPNSAYILWQTNTGDESLVEWGTTEILGNTDFGSVQILNTEKLHTVKIEGLQRFTKYYYRVKTGTATSEIFSFKTPPFATDNESFRIVAMSDMQQDGSHPNKFNEVIEEGVLDYLAEEIGGELIDNLAMVLIPGDLVPNGNSFLQWENTFFEPAENLFNQIPVYPVTGNHEYDSPFYFQYFQLPENGTPGFEEHWWYKDYGNTRIIGMDSNFGYRLQEQLDWLVGVLDDACANEDIDFVFAQLHHPHLSELWTPGELDYTGDVIERLENFSTDCGKPSIHFFGHTHAYSRGQSRDHKHLWINAATAGGAIDNWGEFPNFDYDEFSISDDDYGFVMVEVTDDNDPKITVKRLSRGDQDVVLDNVLTDSLVLRKNPTIITTPNSIFPVDIAVFPECVTLKAGVFSSPNSSAQHGQSHWQVTNIENDFTNLIAEKWKNYENWYFEVDTQAEDDLTDETIDGLGSGQNYWWRVRYRDRELNWSDWTMPSAFSTSDSQFSANLIANPGAESNLDNWTIIEGVVETVTDGECAGTSPHSGTLYFAVGGLCEHSDIGRLIQDVDVSSNADSIDNGSFIAYFGGYLSDWSGVDLPEMKIIFLDNSNTILGESESLSTLSSSWLLLQEWTDIPPLTRTIRMELKGTRFGGTDNDSYIDDVFLRIGSSEECLPLIAEDIELRLSVFLEGPYDDGTQTMTDLLRESGNVPLTEPYASLGYEHVGGGGEVTTQSVLEITGNDAVVDWIFVELRDANDSNLILATQSALLQRDGDIVAVDGFSSISFNGLNAFEVHVVLRHRNHFGIRTATPQLTTQMLQIDFSNPAVGVFGLQPMVYINGVRAMVSGDANKDGQINSVDKNNFWRLENGGVFDYMNSKADFNLDGAVNPVDKNTYWRPNNSKVEQID